MRKNILIFLLLLIILPLLYFIYNNTINYNSLEKLITGKENMEEINSESNLSESGDVLFKLNKNNKKALYNIINNFVYSSDFEENFVPIDRPLTEKDFELVYKNFIDMFLFKCISTKDYDIDSIDFIKSISEGNLSLYNYLKENTNINTILSRDEVMPFIKDTPYNYELHLGFLYKLGRISEEYYNESINKILLKYKKNSPLNNVEIDDQVLYVKLVRDLFLKNITNHEVYCKGLILDEIKNY